MIDKLGSQKVALSLIERSMGRHHGAHLGPTGPRWAPCWPNELCYLGIVAVSIPFQWSSGTLTHWNQTKMSAISKMTFKINFLVWKFVCLWCRLDGNLFPLHYSDVIMGAMASQINSLMIVYSTVYSGAEKKHIKVPRHWPLRAGNSPVTGFGTDGIVIKYHPLVFI